MNRLVRAVLIISMLIGTIIFFRCGTLDVSGGPGGIAVDSIGNVYVTYPANGYINKFTSTGTLIARWSPHIPDWSRNSGPAGIAMWPGGAYVCVTDIANGFVQIYTSSGVYQTQYGMGAEFNNPEGIAVDSGGNVYVGDYGNNRVYIFIHSGGVSRWNTKGSGDGEFEGPIGIAADSMDNVYVADYRNNRIQKFTSVSSGGTYIMQWGTKGRGDGQFEGPQGIAVGPGDNVYVADSFNDRIQKFDSNGNYLAQWGTKGNDEGQFEGPQGVAVDSTGNVYVSDTFNHRIQKFDSNGNYLTQWQ